MIAAVRILSVQFLFSRKPSDAAVVLLLRLIVIRRYENRRVRREAIYAEIKLEEIEQRAAAALRNTTKARFSSPPLLCILFSV
jgi:hypothetical protein